jgi:hypothetical protein
MSSTAATVPVTLKIEAAHLYDWMRMLDVLTDGPVTIKTHEKRGIFILTFSMSNEKFQAFSSVANEYEIVWWL